jgi:hypothetical protein
MDIVSEIRAFVPWHWSVLRGLVRHAGTPVLWSIACQAGAQFAQILALFLPLKILILLGSDGVPTYFRPFMTESSMSLWIAALTLATVALYGLSVVLVAIAKRCIGHGTTAIFVPSEAEGGDPRNDRRQLHRLVDRLSDSYADVAIAGVAWLGILVLNPAVAAGCALILMLQCGLTQWVLNHPGAVTTKLRKRIRAHTHEYVRSMGDIGFLAVFILLVIDFSVSGELNVISAVLTLLLGRRMYPALARYVQKAMSLTHRRTEIRQRLFGRGE